MHIMFNTQSKQAKNAAIQQAVQQFIANGGTVKTRKSNVPERKGVPKNYFTSAEAPKHISKMETWEVMLARLAVVLNEYPGTMQVKWNDGRVANSKEEMYGL